MKLPEYIKLEQHEAAIGRRELATAYFFIIISAVMFAVFFISTRELVLAGCAFLCDAAALVYVLRAVGKFCPFRQATLARRCAAEPGEEALLRLCAALEAPEKPYKYGAGCREAFTEAREACEKAGLSDEIREQLEKSLSVAGVEL